MIILLGAFVGPTVRKYTPGAAMLGTLAGISITFISMQPAARTYLAPVVGLAAFAIILIGWTANVRLPWNFPAGLGAVLLGTLIGWVEAEKLEGVAQAVIPPAGLATAAGDGGRQSLDGAGPRFVVWTTRFRGAADRPLRTEDRTDPGTNRPPAAVPGQT